MNPSPISTDDVLPIGGAFDPARHIVHVPVARFVELDCDHCLRGLEALGVRVDRSKGSSAIDLARNIRATDAIRDGFDSVLFIDCDILFDPVDAVSLLRSPEPVIAGGYAAKKLGNGQLNVALRRRHRLGPDRRLGRPAVSGQESRGRVPADQDGRPEADGQAARAAVLPDGRPVRLAVLPADGRRRKTARPGTSAKTTPSATGCGRSGSCRRSTRRFGSTTSATMPTASKRPAAFS